MESLLPGEVFRYVDFHNRILDYQLYYFHDKLYDRRGRLLLRVQVWHGEPVGDVYTKMAHFDRAEVMHDTARSIEC